MGLLKECLFVSIMSSEIDHKSIQFPTPPNLANRVSNMFQLINSDEDDFEQLPDSKSWQYRKSRIPG